MVARKSLMLLLYLLAGRKMKDQTTDDWNYADTNKWIENYPTCQGNAQSPINLDSYLTIGLEKPPLKFENYETLFANKLVMVNNGHSAKIAFPETVLGARPTISGGLLDDVYEAESMHFHWGSPSGVRGSEHTINGQHFDVELHIVHKNLNYNSKDESKLYEDGIAVLAVMFEIVDVAVPDLIDACKNADILIFVVPHQFIPNFCKTLLGKIKPNAIAISLIKGFDKAEGGGIDLISHIITRHLKIPCSVLMGANLANEEAQGNFCETTIGCRDVKYAKTLRDLFQADFFRVVVVDDADAVEVCGALKNIVATGAGFVDGLGLGDNTKAAVIRLGLMEMVRFVDVFYPGSKLSTFFESCGVADLITACYGGRNRRVAEAFVKTGKTIEQLEVEMLNGQKLQGPPTAEEVNYMLKNKGLEDKFPLFTAIHKICAIQF